MFFVSVRVIFRKIMSPFANNEGFTLIEVLVAIVILAVGLISVIEGMARTEQAFRLSQNLVTASQLLEDQLTEAEMNVRQYHKLHTGQDRDVLKLPGREFNWFREVRPYVDASIEDRTRLNEIQVVAEWKEGPHRQNSLELRSLIVNRDKIQ